LLEKNYRNETILISVIPSIPAKGYTESGIITVSPVGLVGNPDISRRDIVFLHS